MTGMRQGDFDPRAVFARAGSLVVALSHEPILAWPSTWVVAVALAMAPGLGRTPLHAPLPNLSAVQIPMSAPLPLPTAIEMASPFQPSGAFPLTLPQAEPYTIAAGIAVTMTAFASEPEQTDDEPFVTASGRRVRPGTLALSRDLLRTFTPGAPFDFGDRVRLSRYGEFIVDDTMNPRWTHRVDVWMPTSAEAQEFGKKRGRLFLVEGDSKLR